MIKKGRNIPIISLKRYHGLLSDSTPRPTTEQSINGGNNEDICYLYSEWNSYNTTVFFGNVLQYPQTSNFEAIFV